MPRPGEAAFPCGLTGSCRAVQRLLVVNRYSDLRAHLKGGGVGERVQLDDLVDRLADVAVRVGIGGDLPQVTAPAEGIRILDALRELGFAASNKEARRKLDEGAVKVGGVVIRDANHVILPAAEPVPVSLGAKKHGLVTGQHLAAAFTYS